MPKDNSFFDESSEQSLVKSAIVAKYFRAWATVMMSVQGQAGTIAYVDLFAGPGQYKDGTKSTPLLILDAAIVDESLCARLMTKFNDKDPLCAESLCRAINAMPSIETLAYRPEVRSEEVGSELVKMCTKEGTPTLFFIDPWGYKGVSLELIGSIIKGWGCDCILFFNYNRIYMGLRNDRVREHMDALFGKQRAGELRTRLNALNPYDREFEVVEEICQALKATGGKYVLPFCFKNEGGKRTSHHLIFISKGFKGYEIMKEIMARESTSTSQGVARFEYSPAQSRQQLLFDLIRPIDDLASMLLNDFNGQTISMREIYEKHSVDRPYVRKNYKSALMDLEQAGKIIARPPEDQRRKNTFGDRVIVEFPLIGG